MSFVNARYVAVIYAAVLVCILPACTATRARAPQLPSAEERCRASAGTAQPIVAEWNAAERAQLEALSGRGAIAVSYTGCELHIIVGCGLPGHYAWRRTTTSSDEYAMRNDDELEAQLPLAAASLRASLQQQGGLRLTTTVVGQVELEGYQLTSIGNEVACNEATHIVRSISIGASELHSMASRGMGGGASNSHFGVASASTNSEESVMHRSGNIQACATAGAENRPQDCAAPIQLMLEPISRASRAHVANAPLAVSFSSADSDVRWDIESDGRALCQTPCEQVIDPRWMLQMRAGGGFMQREQRVDIADLAKYRSAERLTIRVHARNTGKLAAGATLATFGGLAVATGITLMSVGYGTGHKDLGTAGVITFVTSPALLIPGIWLLIDSMAKAEIMEL